ncbi:putative Inner membrane protein YiaH [Vibrio chagasii]|nr:putative Inner membrane protein YiaH [Vibrio chagasii]
MRSNSIDTVRLIASFFVIILHVGYYEDISHTFGELVRISGRWAIPFFFLVSGYFIGLAKKEDECYLQSFKIVKILFASSILYLPYCFVKNPDYLDTISIFHILKTGTYFHLWFLSSMVFGLLSFQLLYRLPDNWLALISFFLILFFIVTDVWSYTESKNVLTNLHGLIRHTMSLAFIILGYLLAKKFDLRKLSLGLLDKCLIFFLCAFFFIEPMIIEWITSSNAMLRQFPVFTFAISIGIFITCLKVNINSNLLAYAGKYHSLGIYLVHPLFIPVFFKSFSYLQVPPTIPTLMMSFFCSWVFVIFLMKYVPFLYNFLYGNYSLIRKL